MLGKYEAETLDCCPVCGGEGRFITKEKASRNNIEVSVYVCQDCETMYHNPMMTQNSMSEFYHDGDYMDDVGPRRLRGTFGERSRALRIVALLMLQGYKLPKRALDVGCSLGYLLERVKDWSYEVETVGYDLYPNKDALCPIVTDKNGINGKFDLITCIHVLEHMHNPIAQLEWMDSILEEDGILVIEVPTVRYILPEHPVTFSIKAVKMMMEHIGMTDYRVITAAKLESCVVFGKKGKK